jgi:hypothetical protein
MPETSGREPSNGPQASPLDADPGDEQLDLVLEARHFGTDLEGMGWDL